MEPSIRILISTSISVAFLLLITASVEESGVNKSAPAAISFFSTAEEQGEEDLLSWKLDDDFSQKEQHQIDGGFSSLEGMLQWAVGHSDPEKLKEAAEDIKRISPAELKLRQMELKELMENSNLPSDAKLMKIAIDDLNNLSLSSEDRHRALEELFILVEPIDNGNDLHKLGGLTAIIRELSNPDSRIRCISAWILGKASQNNPIVQKQILELGALVKLMEMANSSFIDEASKALYAISALIRNNHDGQDSFFTEDGDLLLQNILSNSSIDMRLRRRAVLLLDDLVKSRINRGDNGELLQFSNQLILKSVVDLIAYSQDLDIQEKALYAVKNLLLLRSINVVALMEVCELDVVLGKMKQQLQQLGVDDDMREYSLELEILRGEVELIFLEKLDKVRKFNRNLQKVT